MNEQIEYNVYENVFYENAFYQETKFHNHNHVDDHNRVDEEAQNLNFVKTHFLTKPAQFYRYRFYNADFVFNNQLHKHFRIIYNKFKSSVKEIIVINFDFINKFIVITSATEMFASITFHVSKIVHSNVTNVTIKEYVFRKHRFVTTLMMFVFVKQNYEFCFDTKYIMSFIDRKFLFKVFSSIVIKKISTFITMRDIDVNMHNVNEYIKLQIYLFNINDIVKVKREFHIVDNLAVKALIDINIMKSKSMILDIKKNVIIIELYKNIQIFFIFINHRSLTRVTIFNNNKMKITISSHFNITISIVDLKCRSFKLSNNRDFLFESQKLDTLSVYIHIVDHSISKVFVKNDINYIMSLSRKVKLRVIIDYEITKCYVIDFAEHDLATKTLKRLFN